MANEVLLLQSASLILKDNHLQERYPYPPMGLLSIAGILRIHGYKVLIIDLFQDNLVSQESFIKRITDECQDPVVVGIETYTPTIYESLKIAKFIKDIFPKTKIVTGGPHVTFEYNEIMKYNYIDFVVRNEGEAAMVELLEHIKYPELYPASKILGLVYREKNVLKINPSRPFLTHLDIFPLPFYDITSFNHKTNRNTFVFMTSRGCPGRCVFCSSRAMSGGRYRFNTAEWLISLVYFYNNKLKFNTMTVMDDTFLANWDRINKFCEYLRQCNINVPWSCKSRIDIINEKLIKLIHDHNCISLHIGVESGDDNVLKEINKGITVEKIFNAIKLLKKYNIRPECSFIIGHHQDTLETIEKTILLAKIIRDHKIGFTIIGISTPFPGTPLYRNRKKYKLKFVAYKWNKYDLNNPIYYTDNFQVRDLKKVQYYFDVDCKYSLKKELNLSGKDHSEFKVKLNEFVKSVKN